MGNAFNLPHMPGEGASGRRLQRMETIAAEPRFQRLELRRLEHGVACRLAAAPADRLTDGKVIATRHYGLHEIFLLFLQPGCPGFSGYHINSDFVAVLAA